jgi:hypothetical protein
MSNYSNPLQPAVCRFRDATDRITSNMGGVGRTPKKAKCACCEKYRTEETGKWLKSGSFLCHHCGKVAK